jgi:hypothetical protein
VWTWNSLDCAICALPTDRTRNIWIDIKLIEFIKLLFFHSHLEAEEQVKHNLGMTGMASQPNISDDYFKSKRASYLNALKCKTGVILAKTAAMRVTNLEPAYLAPPLCPPSFCASTNVSVYWCS